MNVAHFESTKSQVNSNKFPQRYDSFCELLDQCEKLVDIHFKLYHRFGKLLMKCCLQSAQAQPFQRDEKSLQNISIIPPFGEHEAINNISVDWQSSQNLFQLI